MSTDYEVGDMVRVRDRYVEHLDGRVGVVSDIEDIGCGDVSIFVEFPAGADGSDDGPLPYDPEDLELAADFAEYMEPEHESATEVEATFAVVRLKPRGTIPKSGDTVCYLYPDGTIGNVQTLHGDVEYEGGWHGGHGWLAGNAGYHWVLDPGNWGALGEEDGRCRVLAD